MSSLQTTFPKLDKPLSSNVERQKSSHEISRFRFLLWSVAIVTALLQAWAFRYLVNPDGLSYLDIARACARGDWNSLVNGYWSPLYPFLLSLALRIVNPSSYWESTVAHLVNFGIFVLAFVSFEVFLKTLIDDAHRRRDAAGREAMSAWSLWMLGDSLFVCYTLLFMHVQLVQPDLLVAAVVYLAAALLLRIRAAETHWLTYAGLGVVLGVAYFAKAAMFPLAFVFLGCCLFAHRPLRMSIPRTALALVFFLLTAVPFLFALSKAKGRITFGDSGAISYAEFINGATPLVHWQGEPGRPAHPTRLVRSQPAVFEFATPVKGTYPPWYDPSYWHEGITPRFRLGSQLRAIFRTMEQYGAILPYMAGLLVGFVGLALLARPWLRDILKQWPLWVPAAAAVGLYGLVYVESRYVAPFFIVIWMGLFAGLRFRKSAAASTMARYVTIAMIATACTGIALLTGAAVLQALNPQPFVKWEVAEGLREIGIRPGDQVGSMGLSWDGYWAHLADVRIVVEIPFGVEAQYWASSPEIQSEVLADFAKSGAKVVVARQIPASGLSSGWHRISGTDYFVHDVEGGNR